jgi:3-dehydroquinate dehydratase-1
MREIRMGASGIGSVPRVVGTVSAYETLKVLAGERRRLCDVVEVRLDLVGVEHRDWLARCRALEAAGWPVLLTLRLQAEGGQWARADAARLPLLRQACRALSAIDVEAASPLCARLCALAESLGKPIVVSAHDFEKTPSLARLQALARAAWAFPNAIPKVAAMIRRDADEARLRRLLAWAAGRPLCVIGMGPGRRQTRVEYPVLGSALTYGYLDESAAPGQWPAPDLVRALRLRLPAYRRGA